MKRLVMEAAVTRTIKESLTLGPGMFLMWKESVLLGDTNILYISSLVKCTDKRYGVSENTAFSYFPLDKD